MAEVLLALPERLTLSEADQVLTHLGGELSRRAGAVVEIDAGPLRVFDSSALAVLLELRRRLLAKGQSLSVSRWPGRLEALASLYGVRELLAT